MPDGLGGFGLAAKVAMSVPDKGGSAWSKPDGQSSQWRDARVDDGPDTHEFRGSWLSGNRCSHPGCGQSRQAHLDGE